MAKLGRLLILIPLTSLLGYQCLKYEGELLVRGELAHPSGGVSGTSVARGNGRANLFVGSVFQKS